MNIISTIKRQLFILLLLAQQATYCQQSSFPTTINKASPFPLPLVHLSPSWIQHREALNVKYLQSLDPERLLHNFRVNAGLPSQAEPLEGWESPHVGLRGHFVGHYLSAVALIIEKTQDSILSRRLAFMVNELYKCQQALGNGYLGAFPQTDFDILETRFGGVWAPYYTYHKLMQGLLNAYTCTNNKQAYEMVLAMASYVQMRMSKLDSQTIEKVLYSVGANPSNEAGAMNEVLYKLYKISNDPRHLALAKIFDRDWFVNPLVQNENILSGLHANTHLVLVNGFAQRYEATGEKKYYNAVRHFWHMLHNYHSYANGTSSGPRPNVVTSTSLSAEHWGKPGVLSNTMTKEIAESCVSHNTQKLTSTLFAWTANPAYADAYMNTFYNAVLPSQSAQSGKVVYHLPLGSPCKKLFLNDNDFRCCNGCAIEAFAGLSTGIYYHNNSALWVNLYLPSQVQWKDKNVVLTQSGNFPTDSVVEFTVSAKASSGFELKLFNPSWTYKTSVFINNVKYVATVEPNTYISLKRKWNNNDKVKLVFHYNFHLQPMPDDKNVFAIFYGPTLLAFITDQELILKGKQDDILKRMSKDKTGNKFYLTNDSKQYELIPLYDIEEQNFGVYATLRNY